MCRVAMAKNMLLRTAAAHTMDHRGVVEFIRKHDAIWQDFSE